MQSQIALSQKPDTTNIPYGSTVRIRWTLPEAFIGQDWFRVFVEGITYTYKDSFDVRSWYIKPDQPDTSYAFFQAIYPHGFGKVCMTRFDSSGVRSELSNYAYFRMKFGAPVIIDLSPINPKNQ